MFATKFLRMLKRIPLFGQESDWCKSIACPVDEAAEDFFPQIIWLDSHDYLMSVGVHASDGVHYKDDTNLVLYQYCLLYTSRCV